MCVYVYAKMGGRAFIESNELKMSYVKMPSIDLDVRKHGSSVFVLSGCVYNSFESQAKHAVKIGWPSFSMLVGDDDDDDDDEEEGGTNFMCKLRLIINDILISVSLNLHFRFELAACLFGRCVVVHSCCC